MKLRKKEKQLRITIRKLNPLGKAFQAGGNEVLNNPGKYGLKPKSPLEEFVIDEGKRLRQLALNWPTDEEIEEWFTGGGNPDEKYWQDAPYTTMADVFEAVKEAFDHFKNRKA